MKITKGMVNTYKICPRLAWLKEHIEIKATKEIKKVEALSEKDEELDLREDTLYSGENLLEIEGVLMQDRPPYPRWVGGCLNCQYGGSCYSD